MQPMEMIANVATGNSSSAGFRLVILLEVLGLTSIFVSNLAQPRISPPCSTKQLEYPFSRPTMFQARMHLNSNLKKEKKNRQNGLKVIS